MALDPSIQLVKGAQGKDMRVQLRLSALEGRIEALERNQVSIQVTAGQPTNTPRPGTAAADSTNNRLWLYINGAWRYTALT